MRAGKLDKLIVIQRAKETFDAAGAVKQQWCNLVSLRAQMIQTSSEEFSRAFGSGTETSVIFRTWYLPYVTVADRILYCGQVHDIKELKELGRRQGLELRTVARGIP